jgi:hypothetical protein
MWIGHYAEKKKNLKKGLLGLFDSTFFIFIKDN